MEGYYVRIAPPPSQSGDRSLKRILPIKNRARDPCLPAEEQVSTDFLHLVRWGLRDAHDPLVVDSVKVVDSQLGTQTPTGPAWHRYTGDGYGEQADGSAFNGAGQGRAWPLLTGERGHYEILAGRDPLPYLVAMSAMTGPGGLIPEQVWDAAPLPERHLWPGRPTGSAMPLAWAHAEFVKLATSRELGRPCDRPEAVWQRYGGIRPAVRRVIWTPRFPVTELSAGIGCASAYRSPRRCITGSMDGRMAGIANLDKRTRRPVADLPVAQLDPGDRIEFTFFWSISSQWEGLDYRVAII